MQTISSFEHAVDLILENTPTELHLGTPLGLGKPHLLLNALYERIAQNPSRQLNIYTALSLNPPVGKSDMEKRFLAPFVSRVYGDDFPRLAYADAVAKNALPDNVIVEEFYMQSGALLGSLTAQTNYASLNYTSVADALAERGVNLMVQRVAMREDNEGNKKYSLSCNTDLSADTLDAIIAVGKPKPFCVAEVDPQLPWVGGSAVVPDDWFDVVIEHDQQQGKLFALPRQPVGDVDYAIGLYASTLVKDGGTLQIGIGALADALCHALVLRHTDNDTYRQVLKSLDPMIENNPAVKRLGALGTFEQGLYGCSEMINEGFRLLVEKGILRRRVLEDTETMNQLNTGEASPEDLKRLEQTGQFLHGAFYLGSPDFYDWVRSLSDTDNTLGMQRVSLVNSVAGEHFSLEKAQRQHARFFNTCMMATALGGAASETLPNGRVVSGVGGQYNFVNMGHTLPNAASVLMLRSKRTSKGDTSSNILWSVENMTIPRHLRDVYVTEYGIADLRHATDGDCVRRMVSVTDAAFQEELISQAEKNIKANVGSMLPTDHFRNSSDVLASKLEPFRKNGSADAVLPDYPLGSDFTPVEQRVVKALQWLKSHTQDKVSMAKTAAQAAASSVLSDPVDVEAMQRMGFANPDGVEENLAASLFELALEKTQ